MKKMKTRTSKTNQEPDHVALLVDFFRPRRLELLTPEGNKFYPASHAIYKEAAKAIDNKISPKVIQHMLHSNHWQICPRIGVLTKKSKKYKKKKKKVPVTDVKMVSKEELLGGKILKNQQISNETKTAPVLSEPVSNEELLTVLKLFVNEIFNDDVRLVSSDSFVFKKISNLLDYRLEPMTIYYRLAYNSDDICVKLGEFKLKREECEDDEEAEEVELNCVRLSQEIWESLKPLKKQELNLVSGRYETKNVAPANYSAKILGILKKLPIPCTYGIRHYYAAKIGIKLDGVCSQCKEIGKGLIRWPSEGEKAVLEWFCPADPSVHHVKKPQLPGFDDNQSSSQTTCLIPTPSSPPPAGNESPSAVGTSNTGSPIPTLYLNTNSPGFSTADVEIQSDSPNLEDIFDMTKKGKETVAVPEEEILPEDGLSDLHLRHITKETTDEQLNEKLLELLKLHVNEIFKDDGRLVPENSFIFKKISASLDYLVDRKYIYGRLARNADDICVKLGIQKPKKRKCNDGEEDVDVKYVRLPPEIWESLKPLDKTVMNLSSGQFITKKAAPVNYSHTILQILKSLSVPCTYSIRSYNATKAGVKIRAHCSECKENSEGLIKWPSEGEQAVLEWSCPVDASFNHAKKLLLSGYAANRPCLETTLLSQSPLPSSSSPPPPPAVNDSPCAARAQSPDNPVPTVSPIADSPPFSWPATADDATPASSPKLENIYDNRQAPLPRVESSDITMANALSKSVAPTSNAQAPASSSVDPDNVWLESAALRMKHYFKLLNKTNKRQEKRKIEEMLEGMEDLIESQDSQELNVSGNIHSATADYVVQYLD